MVWPWSLIYVFVGKIQLSAVSVGLHTGTLSKQCDKVSLTLVKGIGMCIVVVTETLPLVLILLYYS